MLGEADFHAFRSEKINPKPPKHIFAGGLGRFGILPKTSVALGVLAVLVEDQIPDTDQILCAGTGLCGLQGVSRGLPPLNKYQHLKNERGRGSRRMLNFYFSSYRFFYDLLKFKSGSGSGQF